MGIMHGNEVLYIAKEVDSARPYKSCFLCWKKLPAYCTALGKAMLSDTSFEEIKKNISNKLVAFTKNTITSIDVLYKQLQDIKKTNIATEFGNKY